MKKIIAIAMALVMMMAICVPAFAATLNKEETSGDAIVKTTVSEEIGDGTYTVTYPATMDIVWGDTETGFSYSVESQLKTGKGVSVAIADKADGFFMVNADGATLAYSLSGATTAQTEAPVVTAADATYNFSVDIDEGVWAAAAYDTYEDTLTFASAVVDL